MNNPNLNTTNQSNPQYPSEKEKNKLKTGQLPKDFKEIMEKYSAMKKDLLIKKQKLNSIGVSSNEYKKKYAILIPKYKQVVLKLENANNNIKQLIETKENLQKELSEYTEKYKNLRNKEKTLFKRIKKKIYELRNEIDQKQSEINNFNTYKQDLAKYKKAYNLLYDEHEELKKEFEKAIDQKEYIFKDIGQKEEKISDMTSEVRSLRLKYSAANRKIEKLEEENKNLLSHEDKKDLLKTAKLTELNNELKFYKEEISRLENERKELFNQINNTSRPNVSNTPEFLEITNQFNKNLESVFNEIPIGVVVVQNYDTKFVNNYLNKMLGSDTQDIFSVIDNKSASSLRKQLNEELNKSIELKIKQKNIFLSANIIELPYLDNQSKAILLRDITYLKDPKKAKKDVASLRNTIDNKELEITRLEKQLENISKKMKEVSKEREQFSKKLTKAIDLDSSLVNSIIILSDEKGYVSSVNDQTTNKLGYTLRDFINIEEDTEVNLDFIGANEKEVKKIKNWIESVNKNKQPVSGRVKVKTKKEEVSEFILLMELILDIDSEPIGIVTLLSQI